MKEPVLLDANNKKIPYSFRKMEEALSQTGMVFHPETGVSMELIGGRILIFDPRTREGGYHKIDPLSGPYNAFKYFEKLIGIES